MCNVLTLSYCFISFEKKKNKTVLFFSLFRWSVFFLSKFVVFVTAHTVVDAWKCTFTEVINTWSPSILITTLFFSYSFLFNFDESMVYMYETFTLKLVARTYVVFILLFFRKRCFDLVPHLVYATLSSILVEYRMAICLLFFSSNFICVST